MCLLLEGAGCSQSGEPGRAFLALKVPNGTTANLAQDGSAICAEPNPGMQKQKKFLLVLIPAVTGGFFLHSRLRECRPRSACPPVGFWERSMHPVLQKSSRFFSLGHMCQSGSTMAKSVGQFPSIILLKR